jgi:hypothetical protein
VFIEEREYPGETSENEEEKKEEVPLSYSVQR